MNAKKNSPDTYGNLQKKSPFDKKQAMIVKKASKLFIKKGYSQTSMRDIAKATAMNLGGLYHYINSKADILCIAFNSYHDLTMDALARKGVLDIEDPKEQLRETLRQTIQSSYSVNNDVLMMYRETHLLPPKVMKSVLSRENELVKLFEGIIERGIKRKIFNVTDPFYAANMIVFQASIYSLRSWNLKRYSREEYLTLTEETILKAIIPENR